jgi:hypothetical protein
MAFSDKLLEGVITFTEQGGGRLREVVRGMMDDASVWTGIGSVRHGMSWPVSQE